MKTTTKMKIVIVLAGVFLLLFSEGLWACHTGFITSPGPGNRNTTMQGHVGYEMVQESQKTSKRESAFGYTTEPTTSSSVSTSGTIIGTTDMSATSSDCKWRTANIEKFFNDSYEQIAEESAQGSGQHLEALASLTGCSVEQYGTFETAMNRNHRYVFADKDYDGSINNFFTVLNTDEDLKQCFGQQSPG